MNTINLHQISAWSPERNKELIDRALLRIGWTIEDIVSIFKSYTPKSNLGYFSNTVFLDLGMANRYAQSNHIYSLLYYYSRLSYANFLVRLNAGKHVEFEIAGKTIETIGTLENSEIGSGYVIRGIEAALVLRNQQALDLYASIPVSFTEQANQEDIIWETMMYFYQTLLKAEGDQNNAAAAHYQISSLLDWEEYKKYVKVEGYNSIDVWKDVFEMRKPVVESQILPVLKIYHRILHNDQQGYEQAVYEALLSWKQYYTMPKYELDGQQFDHSTEPQGYLALPICAACAYGYENGMRLSTVESDYIPKWMIEGQFEGMQLLVS